MNKMASRSLQVDYYESEGKTLLCKIVMCAYTYMHH